MNNTFFNLFGAMFELESSRREQLMERFYETAGHLRELLVSERTVSYLRGAARTHNIPDDKVPKLALGVLYVALGEWPLPNLAAGLSSTMGIPNDTAHKVAAEIEKELFAPIMLEFNKFLEKQRQPKATEKAQQAGASNIIDLKHKSQNTPLRPKGYAGQAPPQTRPSKPELPKPGEFNR